MKDHDDVQRVLEAAGPRPAVPADAMEEARAAALVQWEETVRQHGAETATREEEKMTGTTWEGYRETRSVTEVLAETLTGSGLRAPRTKTVAGGRQRALRSARRTVMGLAAMLAVAVLAVFFLRTEAPPAPPAPIATLEVVHGSVDLLGSGVPDLASPGGALVPGNTVTTGADGRAALRLDGGSSVRLDNDSHVRLTAGNELVLERGAVYVDAAARADAVEVRTALGVVRDIGTQFEVRLLETDGGTRLRVRVREGEIELRRPSADEVHRALHGEQLTLDREGLTRSPAAVYGPQWDWVLATATAFNGDGRTLGEVLEWAAREGGWELLYEPGAPPIVLTGDSRGLAPREVVEMYVASSRLEARFEDGKLVVR